MTSSPFMSETLDYHIDAYIAQLERENASPHTVRNYRLDLQQFFSYLTPTDDAIRVEVRNDEPRLLPFLAEPQDTGGRGLHLVEALATRWGTESSDDQKVVWFELADVR